jgi:DNA polymerase III alpha subunit (gram-positive type)
MYYLVFDCETTGLIASCNVLTAYFMILDNELNIIDELDLKIKYPFYIIFPKALEINKINILEHDKIAISKHEATNKIINFLKKYDTKYLIIGHNINFDIDMLKNNKILTEIDINQYFEKNYLDTYLIAKDLKKNNLLSKCQSLSLTKLCYNFDINYKSDLNFHNAKYDCYMTLGLYKKLIELQ